MATVSATPLSKIEEILGDEAENLLNHHSETVPKSMLHVPGPDTVDRIWAQTDRPTRVLRSLHTLFNHGRLAGTGYMSVLPVDQGIEHSAGASFAPNPEYFDGEKLVELALEGGCNAFASTFGVMGSVARKYAHRIPFICKINHNQLLSYPAEYDQILFGTVREAWELGAVAVGATIYFGSEQSSRQIVEISRLFHEAHSLGMATVLWCYLRNPDFKKDGTNYESSADLTGQANHLGVSIEADIIKQKMPDSNRGYEVINFGRTSPLVYSKLTGDHPIDLCRYQVVNCYMGRVGLLNSGGESKGASDLKEAVRSAVINKRAGAMGLITGRKAFQRPMKDGIALFHAIQDVYLNDEITLA